MQNSNLEKKYFDRLYQLHPSDAFEDTPALKKFSQDMTERIIKSLKPQKTDKVLSLGCANGRIELVFAPLVQKIVGIDISSQAIENAKQKAKKLKIGNADFLVGDAQKDLPFQSKSFDIVLALGAFHHLEKINKALGEIHRVLKDNGVLYSIDPNTNGILRKIGRSCLKKIYKAHRSPNEHDIDIKQMTDWCSKADLTAERLDYLDFSAMPLAFLWPKLPIALLDLLMTFDNIWCKTPFFKNFSSSFILTCRKRTKITRLRRH